MIRTLLSFALIGTLALLGSLVPNEAQARLFPRTVFVEKFGYDT